MDNKFSRIPIESNEVVYFLEHDPKSPTDQISVNSGLIRGFSDNYLLRVVVRRDIDDIAFVSLYPDEVFTKADIIRLVPEYANNWRDGSCIFRTFSEKLKYPTLSTKLIDLMIHETFNKGIGQYLPSFEEKKVEDNPI